MTSNAEALCPCGSGLRAARCCEFDAARKGAAEARAAGDGASGGVATGEGAASAAVDTAARAENAQAFAQRIEAAERAWRAEDRATAESIALQALEVTPLHPGMLRIVAEIRDGERKPKAARVLLRRMIDANPASFWAMNRLAILELRGGDLNAAEEQARAAVRLAPNLPQAHNLMGMVMTEREQAVVGEYHCRRALELSGRRLPLVLSNLALNLRNQGRIAEARELYREVVELAPQERKTWLGWARLEEADRELDAAHRVLDELERVAPADPAATTLRATVFGRQGRYDEALALLQRPDGEGGGRLRPMERLERGRLLDRLGRHDEAWADFAAAKAGALEMGGRHYLEAEARGYADAIKDFFQRTRIDFLPRAPTRTDVAQPIFILGFPRSGTTLLEQTLSAASSISAGDELPMIHELVAIAPRLLNSPLPYPGALAELWMGDQRHGLETLRDHYLTRVGQMGFLEEGATRFTDKMPLNEMNMGLIGLVFPEAPLLHVIRHPLDIMVSSMSNFFTHGAYCSSTLETAARHLVLAHEVVAHYRQEMDLNYAAVRYEDMVDDQEATVRRIFEFVGVAFEPEVLQFEGNRRYARTASYAQVTEKLYDRSRFRYRHYRRHLEPAIPILAPLIERLGYSVD